MNKTKRVPFSIEKAKAGAKIVTRGGCPVRIADYAIKDKEHPILGLIDSGFYEIPETFTNKGRAVSNNVESDYDLFIEEEELWASDKNNDAICASADSRMCFKALQNTKPGEILASKDGADILIFKKVDNFELFSSYYNIQGKPNYSWVNRQFVPATEEQRSLLFQTMKEEGYRWDQYKKELHKIEKKTRRMTNQELSWWLRECPEEHREYRVDKGCCAYSSYDYCLDFASEEVDCDISIRKNGGTWMEPLTEI